MASRERLLPLLALAGAGVGVIIVISLPLSRKRKIVRDFNYFIKEHTSPKKDYITRMPDDILCHIISKLDMKNAVRTSVLSTRWRNLCFTQPNPKFECHKMFESATLTEHNCHLCYRYRFVTAVDNYLRLRSGLPIKSFTLWFCLMRHFPNHLRRWVDCIVCSGVRNLDLHFCCNDKLLMTPGSERIVFPFQLLYSARVLEHVQLSFCILEPNFEGSFNCLKELILYSVPLLNKEVESILSSCPRLRLLNLRYCKLPSKVLVNAFELRVLKIFHCEQVNEIGFSTPNLDYFAYYGKGTLSISRSYVPNLGKLCLGLECDDEPPHDFVGFVQDAPRLHTLWIQATPDQVRYIQTKMPTLSNVHWLSLHVIKSSLDLRDIISLIALCPNLSRFDLSTLLRSLSYTRRNAKTLPNCVNLKLVVLDGFKFDDAQKIFASQLIRCAPALEEMNIYTAYCLYPLGRIAEEKLQSGRRVFSPELISRTRREFQEQASSSASINLNMRRSNPSLYGIVPDEEDIVVRQVVSRQINCVTPNFVEQIKALVGQIKAPKFVRKINEIDKFTLASIIFRASIVVSGGIICFSLLKSINDMRIAINEMNEWWNEIIKGLIQMNERLDEMKEGLIQMNEGLIQMNEA